MSALSARLDKLDARIPVPPPPEADRPRIDFAAIIAEIKAESARVDALDPVARIVHLQDEIAATIAKAKEPPPPNIPGRVPLAASFHAIHAQRVKDGFHSEHHEIRRCEIAILKQHGYDTRQLAAEHNAMAHLPWQWVPESHVLPPDAQQIIDLELIAA